jgi:hypothetical protein
MRDLINIIQLAEDPSLKKDIVDLVKVTDSEPLLTRVLKILKAGDIEDRVKAVLSKDADAAKFVDTIAEMIERMDAPVEEKDAFLKQYPKGIVDIKTLLSGRSVSFHEFLGKNDFTVDLFSLMTTSLSSHGVGPGEVAFAVLSPKIRWSGQTGGGGDLQMDGRAVELKTSVSSGGRWINPRKANMDLPAIRKAIVDAEQQALQKLSGDKAVPPRELPARLNISTWTNEIRPNIGQDKVLLQQCTKAMADGLFNHVDNSVYQKALMTGGEYDILMALMTVGYENYKKYSGFDGILLMSTEHKNAQYFTKFEQIKDRIKIDTTYLYAPEGEAMPKVELLPEGQTGAEPETDDGTDFDYSNIAKPKSMAGKSVSASDLSFGPGAGRERKKADLGRARR